jgi:hypothetical protein
MFGPGFVPSHFVFQPQFSLLFAINPALREILLILSSPTSFTHGEKHVGMLKTLHMGNRELAKSSPVYTV